MWSYIGLPCGDVYMGMVRVAIQEAIPVRANCTEMATVSNPMMRVRASIPRFPMMRTTMMDPMKTMKLMSMVRSMAMSTRLQW